MSVCRAEDIGAAATAGDVKAVEELLGFVGVNFYKEADWFVLWPTMWQNEDGNYLVYPRRFVISLSKVTPATDDSENIEVVQINKKNVILRFPTGTTDHLHFTGVIGHATQKALSVGDELKVGDTVLRDCLLYTSPSPRD